MWSTTLATVAVLLQGSGAAPHDELARAADDVAAWLGAHASETAAGLTWPADPGGAAGPGAGAPTLYAGSAGVVLFFLEHHAVRGDARSLALALGGARELAAWAGRDEPREHGLYTGLAGVGFTLSVAAQRAAAADAAAGEALEAAARRVLERVLTEAHETDAGVRWSTSTDVISGSAGIGLWLLDAAERFAEPRALALAARAGDELLARGRPDAGGLAWRMDDTFPRVMPNLSHGTAGVGLFLARLAEALRARGDVRAGRYLAGALAAGAHLRGVAASQPAGGRLVYHSAPGNEQLFYLGWCHGPTGTVRFLHALEAVSGDPTWRGFADELLVGLASAGLPDARPAGYWDNAGVCCGAAGVASFLARLDAARGSDAHSPLAAALARDLLARGTRDAAGLRWTHSEHRARPELRSTQTGYMQGAAGIGLVLLELATGRAGVTLPDDPLRAAR